VGKGCKLKRREDIFRTSHGSSIEDQGTRLNYAIMLDFVDFRPYMVYFPVRGDETLENE